MTCPKVNPKLGPFANEEEGRRNCDLDINCSGVLAINCNKNVNALDVYLCEGEFAVDTQKVDCVYQKGKLNNDIMIFYCTIFVEQIYLFCIIPNNPYYKYPLTTIRHV